MTTDREVNAETLMVSINSIVQEIVEIPEYSDKLEAILDKLGDELTAGGYSPSADLVSMTEELFDAIMEDDEVDDADFDDDEDDPSYVDTDVDPEEDEDESV